MQKTTKDSATIDSLPCRQTNMKRHLLLLTASLTLTVAQGQTIFQKIYGGSYDETGNSVQQTADGGFIILGGTYSYGIAWSDAYLIKTTSDGVLQWSKTFGGSNIDWGNCVSQTNDGGFISIGYYSFGPGLTDMDLFLIKNSSDGSTQWTKTFGGTQEDNGNYIQQTNDGGYIITGYTYSFGAGDMDLYLVKTSSDGTLIWTNAFGGTNEDAGYSVEQTVDGGFIATGYTKSFGAGLSDVYLIKTGSDGTLQWTKTYGGISSEWALSAKQTTDGGFIITGETHGFGAGGWDVYLIKTSSDGTLQWTKTYGGTAGERSRTIQLTNDGGYIIGGRYEIGFNTHILLMKISSGGSLQWTKIIEGASSEVCNSIQQTNDGGYIAAGYTSSFSPGYRKVYLIKTDSTGNAGCYESTSIMSTGSGGSQGSGGLQGTGGVITTPIIQTGAGGVETTVCSVNGIMDINNHKNQIEIFPNPFSSQTTLLTVTHLKNASLNIYNSFGQTVEQIDNLSGREIIFHRDNLPSGLYFVRLTQDGNTISADKFVIVDE